MVNGARPLYPESTDQAPRQEGASGLSVNGGAGRPATGPCRKPVPDRRAGE